MIIGASMFVPIKLSFDSKSLKIHRPIGRIHIRYQDVKSCYVIDCDDLDNYIRICGSGGVYGLLGYFKHEKYGKVRFFVTDRHQCFIIRMKNGKNYMISSPGCDNIVMVINEYMRCHKYRNHSDVIP